MSDIGLLVLDEAHHCHGNGAYAQIMVRALGMQSVFAIARRVEQRTDCVGLHMLRRMHMCEAQMGGVCMSDLINTG